MINKTILLLVLCSLLNGSLALYGASSPVIKLDASNFQKEVINSKDIWLIEFYAPWCGHCKGFAPEYEKAAKALKGIFKIGAVDGDSEKTLSGQYGIQGFPTIKFFGADKSKQVDYQGGRTADAIVSYMLEQASTIAKSRLSGKKSSSSSSEKKQGQKEQKEQKASGSTDDKDVVVLTDDTFDEMVLKSKDMWLIEYYAPWCGHCQKLQPEWNQAATQLKGQIKFGKVDATVQTALGSRFNVKGYPTIKIFPPGDNKSDKTAEDYEGPREVAGIVSYALEKLEKYGYVPEIQQLINQDILKEVCMDRNGICILTLLPHIVESSAEERNRYLDTIKEVSKNSRGKPIYFLWAQGGDFFDMEEKLHLSFGYPAVVAINFSKKKYSVCRMSFSKDNMKNYIVNLLVGKEQLQNLVEIPKLKKVDEWDKKDAPAPVPEIDEDL